MKRKIIMLITVVILILNLIQVCVLATNEIDTSVQEVANEDIPSGQTIYTAQDIDAQNAESTPVIQPQMALNIESVKRNICLIIDDSVDEGYIDWFEKEKAFPFVIRLETFEGPVDSIAISEKLYNMLKDDTEENTTEEQTSETESEAAKDEKKSNSAESKSEHETEQTGEQETEPTVKPNETLETYFDKDVVQLITKEAQYTWKHSSLNNAEFTADGFAKLDCKLAVCTELWTGEPMTQRDMFDLEFSVDEERSNGVLLVAKDENGFWNITGKVMFNSCIAYIIAIVAWIILTFGIIILVNVVIIKIYKSK